MLVKGATGKQSASIDSGNGFGPNEVYQRVRTGVVFDIYQYFQRQMHFRFFLIAM